MSWLTWPIRIIFFVLWYAKEVVVANVAVLRDNLTPGQASTPGIARVETDCRTDAELTLLAALVTLTPGTLTLGTRALTEQAENTRRVLYVHGMYAASADELRSEVHRIESRMLRAKRRRGGAA